MGLLCLVLLTGGWPARAQSKKSGPTRQPQTEQSRAADQLARTREEFIKAAKDYKASLEKLLILYEGNARRAAKRLVQAKELQSAGLISQRELEESEHQVAGAQSKIAEVRQQIASADTQIADTLVEAQAAELMAQAPPLPVGKLLTTTTYIRYNAPGLWSLSEAWKVQSFFLGKFRRPLPISAFGQSAVHDRWGLDHHNAMDVPINPDAPEGQALMIFLRQSGIPFSAFRMAIPGAATGPHIHVGRPSHKL
ncbi:MAG TPA: TolC family protein [Pyrinomonadaceae bacterium]|jgi:hypothetical protein|nr:TolC family protein [Pyrinomonadaceae bacterium]